MEIGIGPYTLSKKTKYSRYQLFDTKTGKNISLKSQKILKKIIEDYEYQISNPEECFEIKGDKLISFNIKNAKDIKYVFIPGYIKEIEENAFRNAKIYEINFPDSLTTIKNNAFYGCGFLLNLILPDTINYMGQHAFEKCVNLRNVEFSSSLEKINECAFKYCESLTSIRLPDSISSIKKGGFSYCKNLKDIRWSKNLKEIGKYAFEKCLGLEKIDLPSALLKIEMAAFNECKSLKEVHIPDSVESIGDLAFCRCKSLEYIKLPYNLTSLENGVFSECDNLKNIELPDNISRIAVKAFHKTFAIESVNIPKNLKSVRLPIFTDKNKITCLTINHNLNMLEGVMIDENKRPNAYNADLITMSHINKLVITSNVDFIEPYLFKLSGENIEKIDYLGTKEQFEIFRSKNKQLFDKCLINVKDINFVKKERSPEDLIYEENLIVSEY